MQRAARLQAADGAAQAAVHDAHQHQGEFGLVLQCHLKLLVVQANESAGGFRPGGGGARGLRDHRHLAEGLPRPDGADDLVLSDHFNLAQEQHVHPVTLAQQAAALVVLFEYRRARREALRLAR